MDDDLRLNTSPRSDEQDTKRFEYEDDVYRDKPWLFLFIFHLVAMGVLGAFFGGNLIKVMNEEPEDTSSGDSVQLTGWIMIMLTDAVAGGAFGILWLWVMKTVEIKCLLWFYAFFEFLFAGLFFVMGQGTLAFFMGVGCIITVLWISCCAGNSIPFAEAMLKPVVKAIEENKGVICLSFVLAAVQVLWSIIWFFMAMSILFKLNPSFLENNSTDTKTDIATFLLFISYYWTSEVVKNIGHVTIAGTVASWWLSSEDQPRLCPSLKRALTTSFGSICFGSLLVAVLKAIRAVLRAAQRNASNSDNMAAACLLCVANCCLSCIESLVEYFNVYAYTYIAIYGLDYMTSAKRTWELLRMQGITMLINDNITGMVIGLGVILGGLVTAALSLAVSLLVPSVEINILIGIIGFIIGLVMTSLVLNGVTSGIATTFVIWAEDPILMKETRGDYFAELVSAKEARWPNDDE